MKLMNKPYHPQILNEIYIFNKETKNNNNIIFKKINIDSTHPIAPRVGVSCYDFDDKIFIFGGFYER
jgi:hypothetical protein